MKKTIIWLGAAVLGLGLIVLLAFSIAGEEAPDASVAFGEVTVEGNPLAFHADLVSGDPAVGSIAPTVSGSDWNNNRYIIGPDGRSKVVVLMAHWCPHCQAEVPVIMDWIEAGGLPDHVDLYALTVSSDRFRPNWPPQDWLEREGWTVPTIMDDEAGSAAAAYGMTGTPFYIVLDGENRNLGRIAGEIGVQGLNFLVSITQSG